MGECQEQGPDKEERAYNVFRNTAAFYDCDTRDNVTDDIPFYLEYAHRLGGPVLELGCGTGRVALRLAKEGFMVTGLDLSKQMLTVFEEKLQSANEETKRNITIINGNMAGFKLDDKFHLIIVPFRAFQALTDEKDIASSLSCIRDHLDDDGRFIINVFRPYGILDNSWCYPEKVQWEENQSGCKIVKIHRGDRIDTQNQIIYAHMAYNVTHPDGTTTRLMDDLKLKYYYEQQLKERLRQSGFEIAEEYGWYDKTPIAGGRELIFVCRKHG